jgi:hypothetical protein
MEDNIKQLGSIAKYSIIEPNIDTDDFFKQAKKEDWLFEDIIMAWEEQEEFKGIILIAINQYASQFATMKDIPFILPLYVNKDKYKLIFLKEEAEIGIEDLKNIDELSGIGKLLVPFNLIFEDFNTKYSRRDNETFFDLEPHQILINKVRLVLEKNAEGGFDSGIKLTGRAAEIAAKRKERAERIENARI